MLLTSLSPLAFTAMLLNRSLPSFNAAHQPPTSGLHYNAARSRLLMLLIRLSLLACTMLQMVRRGSVVSASACCKAGPSSILGSTPQGGVSSNGKSSIVEEQILRFVFVPLIVEERTLRFCLRSLDS